MEHANERNIFFLIYCEFNSIPWVEFQCPTNPKDYYDQQVKLNFVAHKDY